MSKVRISWAEDKANWLLEQAGDLIPKDPEQITLSQYEHLLSDKIHNVIQEVLQENRVGCKLQDLHCLISTEVPGNISYVAGVGSRGT